MAPSLGHHLQPARLLAQAIDIRAPAYTGLPTRSVDTLAAKVPEGANLHWRLRFAPEPASVELLFHDGRKLALQRDGDEWQASMRIDRPMADRAVRMVTEGTVTAISGESVAVEADSLCVHGDSPGAAGLAAAVRAALESAGVTVAAFAP